MRRKRRSRRRQGASPTCAHAYPRLACAAQVYTSEGIDFEHVEFIDNEPMIELITANQTGILPILDEELVVPNGVCTPGV